MQQMKTRYRLVLVLAVGVLLFTLAWLTHNKSATPSFESESKAGSSQTDSRQRESSQDIAAMRAVTVPEPWVEPADPEAVRPNISDVAPESPSVKFDPAELPQARMKALGWKVASAPKTQAPRDIAAEMPWLSDVSNLAELNDRTPPDPNKTPPMVPEGYEAEPPPLESDE